LISFIIIGKNEGWKISGCIQSVKATIRQNQLKDHEIIYVDSDSIDDSVRRAVKEGVTVYKITSKPNAAIARNIGFKESKGRVLYFIDGDMEIQPGFLPLVYSEMDGLNYPFVSGQLKNFNYDESGSFINNSWQYKEVLKNDKHFSTTGGIFLIQRALWEKVGGMDIRFRRGQDLEIALRLSKKGFKILRKKEIIAHHHTISYTHKSRLWSTLTSGDISYSNSFLFRKHILNPMVYPKILKNYYTLFSFFLFLILSVLVNNWLFMFGYPGVLFLKSVKTGSKNPLRIVELMAFFFIRDFVFLFMMLYPLKSIDPSRIKYERVN
jgi:glycosyltransferase involved in cell wall biosynthesis